MYSMEVEKELGRVEKVLEDKGYEFKKGQKHYSLINGKMTLSLVFKQGVRLSNIPSNMRVSMVPSSKSVNDVSYTVAFIQCLDGGSIEQAVESFKKWADKQSYCV